MNALKWLVCELDMEIKRERVEVERHMQLYTWLGGQGEGEDPFPYYIVDWVHFGECHPPQVLWGYIPEQNFFILTTVDLARDHVQ